MLHAGTGFGVDDGASLLMAFRGLQAESKAQGEAHKAIAKELNTLVADPFNEWAQGYKVGTTTPTRPKRAPLTYFCRSASSKTKPPSSIIGFVHTRSHKGK